jgi:hypothetical protein
MLRGIYCELGRLAIERYADRTGDSFYVSSIELMAVTGAGNPGAAVKRLKKLLDRAETDAGPPPHRPAIVATPHENRWKITIHNLAKRQGFGPRKGALKEPSSTSTSTSTSKPPPDPPGKQAGVTEKPKPDVVPRHPDAMRLCVFYRDELVRLVKCFTPPSARVFANVWVLEMDRMLRLDGPDRKGIEASRIEAVIKYVTTDEEFEQANVQCPTKLRKRFSGLEIKARRGHKAPRQSKLALIASKGAEARKGWAGE